MTFYYWSDSGMEDTDDPDLGDYVKASDYLNMEKELKRVNDEWTRAIITIEHLKQERRNELQYATDFPTHADYDVVDDRAEADD